MRRTRQERFTKVALFLGEGGDEEEVSRLSVRDLRMRVGDVPVRLGGIGGVGTNREHRKKGYASRVMEDAEGFMTEAGLDVAILFGIRDFYPKFAYAVCMADYTLTLATKYAERAGALFEFSAAGEPDHEPVRRLYEETNSSRTGSVVRGEGVWKGFTRGSRYGEPVNCFVAKDASGELEAYVLVDENPEATSCAELAARSFEGYEAAVRFLAEDAIDKRTGEIKVICPYDHPFVTCASRFGAKVNIARPRCGGAMSRLINQRSLFEKLVPLFTARLGASPLRGKKLALGISTELDRTTIGFDGQEASLEESASASPCEIPAPGLMQMVMGYCDPVTAGAKFEDRLALEALRALFPRQEAHMWHPDRF